MCEDDPQEFIRRDNNITNNQISNMPSVVYVYIHSLNIQLPRIVQLNRSVWSCYLKIFHDIYLFAKIKKGKKKKKKGKKR